jgi:hypothetical protein
MALSISKQPFPDFLLSTDAMRLLLGEPLDEPYNAEATEHCGAAESSPEDEEAGITANDHLDSLCRRCAACPPAALGRARPKPRRIRYQGGVRGTQLPQLRQAAAPQLEYPKFSHAYGDFAAASSIRFQ